MAYPRIRGRPAGSGGRQGEVGGARCGAAVPAALAHACVVVRRTVGGRCRLLARSDQGSALGPARSFCRQETVNSIKMRSCLPACMVGVLPWDPVFVLTRVAVRCAPLLCPGQHPEGEKSAPERERPCNFTCQGRQLFPDIMGSTRSLQERCCSQGSRRTAWAASRRDAFRIPALGSAELPIPATYR